MAGPSPDLRLASKLCNGMDDNVIIVIFVLPKASKRVPGRGLGIEKGFGQGQEGKWGQRETVSGQGRRWRGASRTRTRSRLSMRAKRRMRTRTKIGRGGRDLDRELEFSIQSGLQAAAGAKTRASHRIATNLKTFVIIIRMKAFEVMLITMMMMVVKFAMIMMTARLFYIMKCEILHDDRDERDCHRRNAPSHFLDYLTSLAFITR